MSFSLVLYTFQMGGYYCFNIDYSVHLGSAVRVTTEAVANTLHQVTTCEKGRR